MKKLDMFTLPLVALLLFGTSPVRAVAAAEDDAETPSDEHRSVLLEGKVGDHGRVRALLWRQPRRDDGGYSLKGTYHYASQGLAIELWGTIEGDRVEMEEHTVADYSEVTGRFSGTWTEEPDPSAPEDGRVRLSGTWNSPDGKRELPFELVEVRGKEVAELDFYFFAEEYVRRRGSMRVERSQALVLPQIRGDGEAIDRVNRRLRTLAMEIQPMQGPEQPAQPRDGAPTLSDLSRMVRAEIPEGKEREEMEVTFFDSMTFEDVFEISLNWRGVLSVRMLGNSYTGGAHGNSAADHVTFDLESGRELKLDKLLKPGWRDAVRGLAEAALRRAYGLKPQDSLNDAGPLFEDRFELNENWHLTPEGLGFCYSPYEIGPYAAGFINPVIRYADLREWIQPGSPLERLATP